jgi:hypothetical protein
MRVCLLQVFALVSVAAMSAVAADNSIGTWKRNPEKSKYTPMPPNPFKTQTIVREAADGGVKVTSKGQRADGTPAETTYTLKYDGKPAAVTGTGSQFDTISAKQIDANTFMSETRKTGGKYHTTGKIVISKDGKTMTNTSKGTDAEGKPISFTIVYDKQ